MKEGVSQKRVGTDLKSELKQRITVEFQKNLKTSSSITAEQKAILGELLAKEGLDPKNLITALCHRSEGKVNG